MRIIACRSITDCWIAYPNSKSSLTVWEERIKNAECKTHQALKIIFPEADYIPNANFKHLTIFNIRGNHYRLAVDIFFNTGHVFIKWFGTHEAYDHIDFSILQNKGFSLC